ncbi:MAG TPA: transposase [Tepidisphaeraceae bacterium]|nr:transposase [Tepidisphaeraceae bacterium]
MRKENVRENSKAPERGGTFPGLQFHSRGVDPMPHSLIKMLVHCVFSTKGRKDSIKNQAALWAYMGGIARNVGIELIIAGGMPNHIHLLFWLPSTRTLAELIRDFKANSSGWMRKSNRHFEWQQGYGAFSVSPWKLREVKSYIANQEEHHRTRTYEEEFLMFLDRAGIKYDLHDVFD